MYRLFSKVERFNVEIIDVHKPPLGAMPSDQAQHLAKCMAEEIGEFREAILKQDFVGSVDALLDIIYFAVGGLHKMGLNADDAERVFDLVHEANMTKKKGVKESRAVGDAPDAIKPEDWQAPELLIMEYFSGDLND